MKKEIILREQPFRSVMRIKEVESLLERTAISGDTFKVTATDGKKYKLRYVDSLLVARRIERNVKLFPKAFPKFYGREGRYLLFDWLEGKHLAREPSLNECYQIGKLCGEVHALTDINKKKKVDDFFNSRLERIKKARVLDKETIAKIMVKYQEWKKRLKIEIVLELNDLHQRNLMTYKGKVYYLDEEGFGHKVKGLGFAKPLLTKRWIKTKGQKEAFWRGYNEHHSSDYFDKDYRKFITLVQLIRTIATRTRTGADYQMELKHLKGMI